MLELRKAKQISNKAASRQQCVMRMFKTYQNAGQVSSCEKPALFVGEITLISNCGFQLLACFAISARAYKKEKKLVFKMEKMVYY